MPLVPLEFPPGLYRNGTDLQSSGRWRDANLVRWEDASLRPIGGWRTRIEGVTVDPCRAVLAWEDNSQNRRFAFGAADELFAAVSDGTLTDIAPVDLATGRVDAEIETGFGYGLFGRGTFGTPRVDNTGFSEATTWALDTFGDELVACNPDDGRVLKWDLNTANNAAAVSGAPTSCLSLFVTNDRFLFALGAGGDPRKVQWCDREDLTTWTPAVTNEAGDFTLQTQGKLMTGVRARGLELILTNTDAHTATYIGGTFVYSFERVGTSCGLVARKAITSTDAGIFWMGRNGFFAFDAQQVTQLDCDVEDYVFGDINNSQISKAWAMTVQQEAEVWFFYPSGGSNEPDRYVVYNYRDGWWTTGTLTRTAGQDRGAFLYPMMTDATSDLIEHEVGLSYDGATIFAESGPVSLGTGDQVMSVTSLYPDEVTQGDVSATFKTRFYPNGAESEFGPYTMDAPTDVRFSGRQVRMRVEGETLAPWRVGIMRVEAKARGRR